MKKSKKRWWIIGIGLFLLIGAIGALGEEETASDTEKVEKEEVIETTAEPVKEETKKEPSTDEVSHYQNTVSLELDKVQKEFDRIWNEQWVKTFDGVSNGSVNVYDAYKQMTFIETNYEVLEDNINSISTDGLSKDNEKLLKTYKEKLGKAADYRAFAASEAAKMFDEGTFKPSDLDNIKSIVATGDSEMMQAVVDRLTIEDNLGLTEQQQ